jgi:hypothetical protein
MDYNMSHQNNNAFLQFIQDFPAKKLHWSKCPVLTLEEALFISYGVEPPTQQNPVLTLNFNSFLQMVDIHHIWELSKRAVMAGDLSMSEHNHIKSKEFVDWAKKNEIPIKEEFFYYPTSEDISERNSIKNAVEKKQRPEYHRKQIARHAVQLRWYKEAKELENGQSKIKKYTRPTELARNKEIGELIKLTNQIGGLEPIQGTTYSETGVDPEWFSDLFPGETKPGPKKKSRKEG